MLHNVHNQAGHRRRPGIGDARQQSLAAELERDGPTLARIRLGSSRDFRARLDRVLSAFQEAEDPSRPTSPQSDDIDVEATHEQTQREVDSVRAEQAAKRIKCWCPPTSILHPSSPFKVGWDVALMLLILYSVWAIPFRIAFEVPITEALFWIDLSFDFFFLVDMVVNARTGYHTSVGMFVVDDWLVLRNYLLGWFTIDLLSTLPIDTIVGAYLGSVNSDALVLRSVKLVRVLRLFRLLKLARLFKLRKALSAMEGFWAVNPGFLRVIRLMAEVMLMAHLLACAWYWVPTVEAPPTSGRDSWYTVAGIDHSTDLVTRYIISLYWATKSMMSVGYGDVRALSTAERVVSIITQCIGVSVFGFIVANISSMLATLNVRGSLLSEKMSEIREYLHARQVPLELQRRCLRFFSHLWSNRSLFDERGILAALPHSLRNEVVWWGRTNIIESVKLLRGKDRNLVTMLVTHLKPLVAEPQDVLARPGSTADQMFFVMQGVVDGFIPRPHMSGTTEPNASRATATDVVDLGTMRGELPAQAAHREKRFMEVVAVYTVGDHCGETDLIANTTRSVGLRALTVCRLQTLAKRDLLRLLSLFVAFADEFTEEARHTQDMLDVAVAAVHERFRAPSKWAVRELPVVYHGVLSLRSVIPGYHAARQLARTHLHVVEEARKRQRQESGLASSTRALMQSVRGAIVAESARGGGAMHAVSEVEHANADSPTRGEPTTPGSTVSRASRVAGDDDPDALGRRTLCRVLNARSAWCHCGCVRRRQYFCCGPQRSITRVAARRRGSVITMQHSKHLRSRLKAAVALSKSERLAAVTKHGTAQTAPTPSAAAKASPARSRPLASHAGFPPLHPSTQRVAPVETAIPGSVGDHHDCDAGLRGSGTPVGAHPRAGEGDHFPGGASCDNVTTSSLGGDHDADAGAGALHRVAPSTATMAVSFVGTGSAAPVAHAVQVVDERKAGPHETDDSLASWAPPLSQLRSPTVPEAPTTQRASKKAVTMAHLRVSPTASLASPLGTPTPRTRLLRKGFAGTKLEERQKAFAAERSDSKRRLMTIQLQKAGDGSIVRFDGDDRLISGDVEDVLLSQWELLRDHGLLLGSGWWRIGWDMFMTLVVVTSVILTPYRIAFEQGVGFGTTAWIVETVLDSIFALDILLNFRTTYGSSTNEVQVAVPAMIAGHYFRSWFVLDAVTTFPFDSMLQLGMGGGAGVRSVSILRMLRLLKLARLFRLSNILENMESTPSLSMAPSLFRLFKLIFQISFGAHLLGCTFFFITTFGSNTDGEPSWWDVVQAEFADGNLGTPSVGDAYVASLYFAFATITTVGYGDIVPRTNPERVFVIVAVTVGATMFGFVIGSVTALVDTLTDSSAREDLRMKEVSEYLKELGIRDDLARRVHHHFEFMFGIKPAGFNEATLLAELPSNLRNELVLHIHHDTINAIPFFRDSNDEVMVAHVVRLLVPLMLMPGEAVFERGEVGLEMYFITKGEAEVLGVEVAESPRQEGTFLTSAPEEVINVLRAGQFFGELALLLDAARTATVRATSVLHLYALSKEAIAKTIAEYPSLERSIRHALEGAAGKMNRRAATEVRQRVVAEAYGNAWRTFAQDRAATRARAESLALSPGNGRASRSSTDDNTTHTVSASGTASPTAAETCTAERPPQERTGAPDRHPSAGTATVPGRVSGAADYRDVASTDAAGSHGASRSGLLTSMQPFMSSMHKLDTMVRHANRLKHVPPALAVGGSSRSVMSTTSSHNRVSGGVQQIANAGGEAPGATVSAASGDDATGSLRQAGSGNHSGTS